MRTRFVAVPTPLLAVAAAIWLMLPAPAAAQTPQNTPITSQCADCDALARVVRELTELLQRQEADLRSARQMVELIDERLKQPQSADRAAALGRVRAEQAQQINALSIQMQVTRERLARFASALQACNANCAKDNPPPVSEPSAQGDPPSRPPIVVPSPRCRPCAPDAETVKRLQEERARLAAENEKIAAEIGELHDLNASDRAAFAEGRQAVPDAFEAGRIEQYERLNERLWPRFKRMTELFQKSETNNDRMRRIDSELVPDAADDLRRCNESCPLPLSNRTKLTIPLAVAGVVGTVILAGGGGSPTTTTTATGAPVNPAPTVVAAPPVTTPAPAPSPSPQPTPAPQPSASGTYACTACAPGSDPGAHDRVLQVCQHLTAFRAIVGSLTIQHPPPFIDVSGPNYDPSTGAFDLAGRGSIAGFTNVTVRATGTVNTSTGRVEMSYTLGTAGEFPGGQPITYRITLQKQE